MAPIIKKSDKEFDEARFQKYLLQLCATHQKEGKALSFAFIIYDFADYTINKILKDRDYWSTLDIISGNYLSIFYINSQNSYFKDRQTEIQEERNKNNESDGDMHLRLLRPIEFQAKSPNEISSFVQKEFGINESIKTPFIIFFQTKGIDIIDYFGIELKAEKVDEAFIELKNQIQYAVDSIKSVTPENRSNFVEIFNLIKNGVQDERLKTYIIKTIKPGLGIGSIFSLVKKVISGL
ncbi:MAG: hypothetical protein ABIK15_14950 [Pseudomonadota bacterium]